MSAISPGLSDGFSAGSSTEPPSTRRQDRRRFEWGSSALLLPAAILIVTLFLYPVGYSFYLGLTNLQLLGPTSQVYQYTGSANLHQLIHDTVFTHSLVITGLFVIGSGVVGATGIGLALALLMRQAVGALRTIVGAAAVVAWMLPPVTIAIVWVASTATGGTFATIFGVPKADFLFSAPLLVVSLANTWSLVGLTMITFSVALRNIPEDIQEAARMEGAGPIRRFFSITLPLLKPTVITNVLLMTLLSIANFTIVFLMTSGGPNNKTMILPVYAYQQGFQFDHLAYGALIGNVMVLIAAVFGFAYVRSARGSI